MLQSALKQLRRFHEDLRASDHIYMVLVAIVIGLLGGLCAVLFRAMIHYGQFIAWGESQAPLDYYFGLPWYWKIGTPAVGGLFVGLIVHFFAREAKGHGVPEVMEAIALRGGRMRPRVVIGKMVASAICIASGGSVGREGPIVQVGATLGSSIGQWLHIDEKRLRTLVGCGAAAGIAAAFNAPIAGALFAVEIILGDFGVMQFSPIVIAAVSGTVVARHFEGNFPAFAVEKGAYTLESPLELFAYAVMGVCAGLVALGFVKVLYFFEDAWDGFKIFPPLKTVIGGALIGIMALWAPQIYGVGYEAMHDALTNDASMTLGLLLALLVAKILAVSITIGSGGSGGIFAPSLFIGAMAGGAIGQVMNMIWPGAVGSPGAYALVGMGAVVGAGTHAPITAIVMIFELTGNYAIILPLMIACIISTLVATRLQKTSIYTLKLERRGIHVHEGRDINVLKHLKVADVMREAFISCGPHQQLMPIISQFINNPDSSVFVTDKEHCLLGVISIHDIRPLMADMESFENLIIAADMMRQGDFPVVSPDDSLDEVMKRMGGNQRDEIPVIRDGELMGVIWPEDVIDRYNAEIFKHDMAYGVSSMLGDAGPSSERIRGTSGISVAEIKAPMRFYGKSLRELNLRNEYGITLLLIKRPSAQGDELVDQLPDAEFVFQPGDIMLAMGDQNALLRLEKRS
ncbi:chloride channel protein [Candidatus Sumerlaeota bacterium]|nr:chloride channel protein [Candidatus Sumerlaeota bacterium]